MLRRSGADPGAIFDGSVIGPRPRQLLALQRSCVQSQASRRRRSCRAPALPSGQPARARAPARQRSGGRVRGDREPRLLLGADRVPGVPARLGHGPRRPLPAEVTRPPSLARSGQRTQNPRVTPRRLGLLAVVLALATTSALAGCGGSDEESASEQWAGDVCSQLSTWVTSVEEAVKPAHRQPALARQGPPCRSATDGREGGHRRARRRPRRPRAGPRRRPATRRRASSTSSGRSSSSSSTRSSRQPRLARSRS